MASSQSPGIPPGWEGGFAQSNPAFAYPDPDLSSLPMLGNMDNIILLQRQMGVRWPEFSWLIDPRDPDSRLYQMFAPYISRVGYTNEGRVYSVICPQQGIWLKDELCINVEITVTGQRGWVDETTRALAADLTVEGKIWLTPGEHLDWKLRDAWYLLKHFAPPFPIDKKNAIKVTTYLPGDPHQPIFPLFKGETTHFEVPDWARHPNAFTVGNLDVEIGPHLKIGNPVVDEFNDLLMDAFNLGSGNLLRPRERGRPGSVLSWNVWFTPPELVNRYEWEHHAERWRTSIDAHHGSPDGPGTNPKFFSGKPFVPVVDTVEEMLKRIVNHIKSLAHIHF